MGADTSAADARERTPLDVAREKGYVSHSNLPACRSYCPMPTLASVFREFRCRFFNWTRIRHNNPCGKPYILICHQRTKQTGGIMAWTSWRLHAAWLI
uniref:Uncharacterized protein n=1 Tax=Arundo donax TaxID=35708 RepID=A0A0A9EIP9_ARUDO